MDRFLKQETSLKTIRIIIVPQSDFAETHETLKCAITSFFRSMFLIKTKFEYLSKASRIILFVKYSHYVMHRLLQNYIKSLIALWFTISLKCTESKKNMDTFLSLGELLHYHNLHKFYWHSSNVFVKILSFTVFIKHKTPWNLDALCITYDA